MVISREKRAALDGGPEGMTGLLRGAATLHRRIDDVEGL